MKFTIFTGCYNSSKFIERVFKSIRQQTYKNFEWIVIDDASKDNTVELLRQFEDINKELDIKLITLKKNCGVAENRRQAIMMAQGEFFITWDHDDEQLPDQLMVFKQNWEKFGSDSVANLFGFCMDQYQNILGERFPGENSVSNYFKYYKNHFMTNKVKQEKHVCVRTSIIKEYIDIRFDGQRIKDGEMLWARIAPDYNSIFLNDVLRIYYINENNKNNMSNSKSRSEMACSVYFQKKNWVNHFLHKLKHDPILYLRLIFAHVFYGLLSKKTSVKILNDINNSSNKIIAFLLLGPAKLLILKMKSNNSL